MSARDVIVKWWLGSNGVEGSLPRWTSAAAENTDAILSALDAAGYAVVPRDPTADMLVEGNLVIARNRLFATDIYKAMLTAAKETK